MLAQSAHMNVDFFKRQILAVLNNNSLHMELIVAASGKFEK